MTSVDILLKGYLKGKQFTSHCQGDDGLERIGLRVPVVREAFKREFGQSDHLTKKERDFWDKIWRDSRFMESMSLAIYAFQYRSLNKAELTLIKKWVSKVKCWEHSDDLSKIFALAVEENPDWMMATLKKWNKSKNLWERRQSLVGLIEYHGKRKKVLPFKTLISFIRPLLTDQEYYVQKGLGWTLREIYCLYPEKTMSFFEKNLNSIHSTAYSAAVEKLDKKTRQKFRLQRKKYRESLRQK